MLAAVSAFAQEPHSRIAELRRHKAELLEALQSPSAVAPSTGAPAPPATAEAAELSELTGVDPSVASKLLATASSQGMTSSVDRLKRAATLFYEARLDRHQALHDLLQVFASGAIQDDGDGSEAIAFVNEILASSVDGMSVLQCVAQRVGQAEAHYRQAMQAGAAFTAAGVDLREVEVHGMRQDRDALERNHVLLLAEDAYFVACLVPTVSRNEVHALLAALTPMLPAVSAFSGARTDSLAAHGLFFACLAALDRRKLRGDDVTALLQSEWFVAPDNASARAALRLAAAVASTAGHEAAIAAACSDGCFACLLSVLQSQLRMPSFYVITAHCILDAFIFDLRGRSQARRSSWLHVSAHLTAGGDASQVKALMDTNQVALGHLLLSFAAVYAAGQDDLPCESETLWMFVDFIAEELQKVEARSPAVLLGMLQLLHTLVRTEPDVVWAHLHSRGGMVMVGDMVAGAMLEYRNLFAGDDGYTQQQRMFGTQATVRDINLPADDINAMVAYVRVLQHIADVGAFTQARVQALQAKLSQPLLHFLFTLLDYPVPPVLKAALFDLVAAFAADLVAALNIWTLLEESAVIQKVPAAEAFAAAPPRMDISFQFNEVESRDETYPETLAFIRLVTKLLALCGPTRTGPATDAGCASAHVFHFVRDTVFLGLDRRSYRDAAEKWRLAAACHAFFRCHVEVAHLWCSQLRDGSLNAASPGAELLLDFNNEGPAMRRILGAFAGGADRMDQDRMQQHSPDMMACILEGLELLVAAFDLDGVVTPAPGTAQQLTRLDVLLLRDKRRTADLLSYIRCADHPAVRTAAVRLLYAVASRNDRILVALEPHTAMRLKTDVADALERGVSDAFSAAEEALSCAGVAHTIQQLLLTTLTQPAAPGLAHLLLGFEMPADAGALTLEPMGLRSALSVLLQAAVALPQEAFDWSPALVCQENTYHILAALAGDRCTEAATVERVCAVVPLASVLGAVDKPQEQSSTAARTAMQNWRTWVLRLVALTMFHRSDAAGAGGGLGDTGVLHSALFGGSRPSALELLHAAEWRVEDLAPPPGVMRGLEELGIRLSRTGEELFDVAACDVALRQRCELLGQSPDTEFVTAVLQHLVRVNDLRREDVAGRALLEAWSELLVLAICHRPRALRAALQDAPEVAHAVVVDLLFTCLKLLSAADTGRVALLLRVVRAILEHFQAEAAGTQALGALPLPPSSCHDVLRALLGVIMRSDRCEATRHYACASLLSLARMCRPPQWALAPAVLRGTNMGAGAPAWADVSGNVRRELDAGVVAELRRHGGPLLAVLARDALGAAEHGRVQSLVVLEALLGMADGSAGALESPLLLSGLPAAVATALERTPRSVLMLSPRACEAALGGMRAQVSFLLSIARYAPAGATHLVGCGVVLRLAECPVLDALPDESTLPSDQVRSTVLLPALQLVGELLQLLPDSTDVFDQARRFVLAHQEAILRVATPREMDEAAGEQQAALAAVRLLTTLCSRDTGAELSRFREALQRMCWRAFESGQHASSVLVVQCVLVAYLRKLMVANRAVLSLAGFGTAPAAARLGSPSLQLVITLMKRHTAALGHLLRSRFELMASVAEAPGGTGAAEHSMMALDGNVDVGSHRPRGKAHAALDLVRVDADVGTVLQALENAMECVHATLSAEMPAARKQPRELDALRYDLIPVLDELGRLQSDDCGRDVGFLRLVQRRLYQVLDVQ